MDLARPQALLLLGLLPALSLLRGWARGRLARDWRKLGQSGRPRGGTGGLADFLVPLALIVALAGPRLGKVVAPGLPPGRDVVLLVDASRSMGAEDAVPSRLGAAARSVEGLLDLLAAEPGDRVAVVAFAGGAEVRCPLTDKVDAAREALAAIRPGSVRPGGTDLGGALWAALDAFDPNEPAEGRVVVVLTDGEDHSGSWREAAAKLTEADVIVHGATFGDDRAGSRVPASGGPGVVIHEGQPVESRRVDDALRSVCSSTGGTFVPIGLSNADLGRLYRDRIAPMTKVARDSSRVPERVDRSSWLIAASVSLLGSTWWPRRRRPLPLMLLLAIGLGAGPPWNSAGEASREGASSFGRGDYQGALRAFRESARLAPEAVVPRFNEASTLFRLGSFEEAGSIYEALRGRADPTLRAKIDFALGNVMVAQGRYPEALRNYDECLRSSAPAAEIAATQADARVNRGFAENRLPPQAAPDPSGQQKTPDSKSDAPPGADGESPPPERGSNSTDKSPSKGGNPAARPDAATTGSADGPADGPEEQLDAMLDEIRRAQGSYRDGDLQGGAGQRVAKDW